MGIGAAAVERTCRCPAVQIARRIRSESSLQVMPLNKSTRTKSGRRSTTRAERTFIMVAAKVRSPPNPDPRAGCGKRRRPSLRNDDRKSSPKSRSHPATRSSECRRYSRRDAVAPVGAASGSRRFVPDCAGSCRSPPVQDIGHPLRGRASILGLRASVAVDEARGALAGHRHFVARLTPDPWRSLLCRRRSFNSRYEGSVWLLCRDLHPRARSWTIPTAGE